MRSDIDVMTDYILDYLGKEKLTVMSISWGSFYGLDFACDHPEKVECYIGLSQTVGYYEDSVRYGLSVRIKMAEYLKEADFLSEEERDLASQIDLGEMALYMTESYSDGTHTASSRSKDIFFQLYKEHKRQVDSYMKDHGLTDPLRDCDVNLAAVVLFCPYYSLWETYEVNFRYEDDI